MQAPITILIADDNRLMRQTLKHILSAADDFHIVGEAHNGEQALDLYGQLRPDLVLLDINMSPVNGFEATRKLVKQNSEVRIIALSLHQEESYCRNIMRLGAMGYVVKSSAFDNLIEAIREVIAGRTYIDKSLGA